MSGRRKSIGSWVPLLLPAALSALPALVAGWVDVERLGAPTVAHGDLALMAWDVERATRASLLVGPYSRFGWHHPGPLLAYLLAPFWWAAGHHFAGLTVGSAALSATSCAVVILAVGRAGGRHAAWLTAGVLSVLMWRIGLDVLREPWNPDVAMVSLLATGVLAAVVIAGRPWWLPATVVAGSLAVQTHLAALPATGLLLVTASGFAAHQYRRHIRALMGPAIVATVVGALCWALPAYEQATPHGGNLSRVTRFVAHDGTSLRGLDEVTRVTRLLLPLTLSDIGRQLSPEVALPPRGPSWFDDVAIVALLTIVGAAVVRGARRGRPLLLGLGAASATLVVAAVASVATTRGVMYLYLAFPCVAAGIMAWLTGAVFTADVIRDHLQTHGSVRPRWASVVLPASVSSVVLLCAAGAFALPPSTRVHEDPVASHFAQQAAHALAQDPPGSRVMIDSSQSQWPIAAAIAEHLEVNKLHVAAEPNWDFLYDRSAIPDGRERTRLVVIASDGERGLLHRGDRLVNRYAFSELWMGP